VIFVLRQERQGDRKTQETQMLVQPDSGLLNSSAQARLFPPELISSPKVKYKKEVK
jgi:hypothetical protein